MPKRVGINMCHKRFITGFIFGRYIDLTLGLHVVLHFPCGVFPSNFQIKMGLFLCPYIIKIKIKKIIILHSNH